MTQYRITSHRRYCLLKSRAARARGDLTLELVWRAKQREEQGTPLPGSFPSASPLAVAGYTTREDLVGADELELLAVGLRPKAVRAVLAALATL